MPFAHWACARLGSAISLGSCALWPSLNGESRGDPRWSVSLNRNKEELSAIHTIKKETAKFPAAVFEPTREPERYLFTDALNEALGAVCLMGGRIATRPRKWGQAGQDLPINTKGVIAARV